MLFDNYTRTVPLSQRIAESIESVISLGMGPIITSNGETIRVVDTTTGKICFNLENRGQMFGNDGEYHADISPSGPASCARNNQQALCITNLQNLVRPRRFMRREN